MSQTRTLEISQLWKEFTAPHGTHPTLILLRSKEKFQDKCAEILHQKKTSIVVKKQLQKYSEDKVVETKAWKTSISHTKGSVFGVGLKINKHVLGVGIDVEDEKRKISEQVFHRITHDQERQFFKELQPIHFWVIKEAAFKSIPRSLQTVLTDLVLISTRSEGEFDVAVKSQKKIYCRIKLTIFEDFCLALGVSIKESFY